MASLIAYPLIPCNRRWGIQAAIEVGARIHTIFSNSLMLDFFDERQEDEFFLVYESLRNRYAKSWKPDQWRRQLDDESNRDVIICAARHGIIEVEGYNFDGSEKSSHRGDNFRRKNTEQSA